MHRTATADTATHLVGANAFTDCFGAIKQFMFFFGAIIITWTMRASALAEVILVFFYGGHIFACLKIK